ncbi:MAG: LPXTG cell wall anchor domain-containing protein [Sulfolobus sp.]
MLRIIWLFLFVLTLSSLIVNSYSVKIFLEGPVALIISQDGSSNVIYVTQNTTLNLQGNISITAYPLLPGYTIQINGKNVTSLNLNVTAPETIRVISHPTYVYLTIMLHGNGYVRVTLENGTTYTLNSTSKLRIQNMSYVLISTPLSRESIINGSQTNFYILYLDNNTTINVTILSSNRSSFSLTPISLTGIGLGLILLAIYIFFRRKENK